MVPTGAHTRPGTSADISDPRIKYLNNVRPPFAGKKEESRNGAGHPPRSRGDVELSDIFGSARFQRAELGTMSITGGAGRRTRT